jgi:hypothetical protein
MGKELEPLAGLGGADAPTEPDPGLAALIEAGEICTECGITIDGTAPGVPRTCQDAGLSIQANDDPICPSLLPKPPYTPPGVTIHSIGSKWGGDFPDPISGLLDMLAHFTLDPTFYRFGSFFYTEDGKTFHAFGNFLDYSYCFRIEGPLDAMLPIARALKMNRKRDGYLRAWANEYRNPHRKSRWINEPKTRLRVPKAAPAGGSHP